MRYRVTRVAPAVIAKIVRALVISALGAVLGALAVLLGYAWNPALVLEMDRPVSAAATGFYGEERVERETFAWTGKAATLTLPGLDRRVAWTCVVRLRGARADVSTLPEVILAIDGVVGTRHQTSNDFAGVRLDLPPADRPGAIVTLAVSNTFIPPGDPRTLGVIVDRWTCTPVSAGWVQAPRRIVGAAAMAGAVFGLAMVAVGASTWAAIGLLAAMTALMAIPLSWDLGPFGHYPGVAWRLALGLAVALAAVAAGTRWRLGRPLSGPARFVLCFTAIALFLKLLVLLHPSKLIIDAVFHAHRVQWILDGRWFFTQPMPSGVRFPYAIGLYVFAAPWTLITDDFVTLLRLIVTMAEAAGGILLYALIRRFWDDRPAGAVAAVLFTLVPRTFEIVGNANMTNAFGQSVAFAVLGAATVWTLRWGQWKSWTGFMLLTAGALLCHISTFTLLGAILLSLVVAYRLFGGRDLRSPALSILTALGAAAMLAVVVYYGHFGDAYRSAARVQAA
ncbi:MAG: glycosyltransferase family 39 protein, partial [Acidobacteria bacterium]|nr:glycosyltransferase family 39 protein [Acidobacteriota bacterium]